MDILHVFRADSQDKSNFNSPKKSPNLRSVTAFSPFQVANPSSADAPPSESALAESLSQKFGPVRFVKRLRDFVWVGFANSAAAMDAVAAGRIQVMGMNYQGTVDGNGPFGHVATQSMSMSDNFVTSSPSYIQGASAGHTLSYEEMKLHISGCL